MNKRGGLRKKQKFSESQKALLDTLFRVKGGPAEVGRLLGVAGQVCANWRNRGRVPFKYCFVLASKMKVPFWSLNYRELKDFLVNEKCPPWEVVVTNCALSSEETSRILSLGAP